MMNDYQNRARDGQLTGLRHEEVVQATKEFIARLQGFLVNINEISPPNVGAAISDMNGKSKLAS